MTGPSDEHERTMAFAEIALGQIKALKQPAVPRIYEVWYNYATGYNPSLNQKVNETLSSSGTLTDADIELIYTTFISPTRFVDEVGNVNSKISGEIDQVMALVDSALRAGNRHDASLNDVSAKLARANDRDAIRGVIESLVQTASEMRRDNRALEARLKSSKHEVSLLQQNLEMVRNESLTDPLTTLANRKYFDEALARHLLEATASNEPVSLMFTDIDHFKSFNDTYGHLTGDQVLRLVALSVKQNVKGQDIAARFGGEEFAVILPRTTLRAALTVADQIRRAVMSKELMKRSTGEHLGRVTVSIGVATYRRGDTIQSLIERADGCLYAAKRNGRNRVICETDPEVAPSAATQVA
ncbi:MAG TPA: GGDEF domain-containing protein [Xanthobacteraceae bacterium]|jgi:diguanylate cyclase|nr:GGDEF domain-containing protein [Xanthobacteraceae bacterium]